MKSCLGCGTEASDRLMFCQVCGREFAHKGTSSAAERPEGLPANFDVRPDGKTMIGVGSTGLIIGIVLGLFALATDVSPYGSLDVDKLAMQWNLLMGGTALAHIGFLLLLVGFVVRAISFLPGIDNAPNP